MSMKNEILAIAACFIVAGVRGWNAGLAHAIEMLEKALAS